MNKIKTSDTLESIISLYDYKIPFVVAEYVCRIYRTSIVCKIDIKYKTLFGNFFEYKDHINYIFTKSLDGEKPGYFFVRLTGVELNIPIGKDSEFMDKYSNMIFSSSADCGFEWLDDDDLSNKNVKFDHNKYMGRCKLIF